MADLDLVGRGGANVDGTGAHLLPAAGGGPFVSMEDTPQYPSLRTTWWPMLLLFLAANLYSIDRGIVGVLAEQIQTGLAISEVQMGLLLGLAYSLLSGFLGLALGYLVDRHVRRNILAASIILWSVATVAGGLAPNFGWFFGFRMLVGLGEAAIAPAAISIIADMFPPRRRGRGLGCYFIGATIGTALSSIIPGWILGAHVQLLLPIVGLLKPWRSAFVLCGAAGPLIGLLMLTVSEPARPGSRPGDHRLPLRENLAYFWRLRRIMVPLYAGFCLHYVAFVGITAWTAAFLARTYHISLIGFAGQFGLMMLIAGGAGYATGSFVTDSPPCRGPNGKLALLAILPLVALPAALSGFAPGLVAALAMLAGLSFATPVINVAMNATVQELVPSRIRGLSYALLAVLTSLPAGAGGPLAIAWTTEHILGNPALIGRSFLIVGAPALLSACACFLLAGRAYRLAAAHGDVGAYALPNPT
jgi:MFS family permease